MALDEDLKLWSEKVHVRPRHSHSNIAREYEIPEAKNDSERADAAFDEKKYIAAGLTNLMYRAAVLNMKPSDVAFAIWDGATRTDEAMKKNFIENVTRQLGYYNRESLGPDGGR